MNSRTNRITSLYYFSLIAKLLILSICIKESYSDSYSFRYGILKARTHTSKQDRKYCLGYYPSLTKVPVLESEVKYANLYEFGSILNLCDGDNLSSGSFNGAIIFAQRYTNCSLIAQAVEAEKDGASGTIFVGEDWPKSLNASNSTVVSMGLLTNSSHNDLWYFGIQENDTVEIGAYSSDSQDEFYFNYNLIVIWIMAEFSIVVGAYWSGIVRHRLYLSEIGESIGDSRATDTGPSSYAVKEESSLKLSPKVIFILVMLMCIMMISLWFLLQYLVYIIIALFCLASFFAVYCCLEPLVLKIPCCKCRTPYFNLYLIRGVLEVRQIILLFFAAALPIIWFIFRRNPYAWILQDILGIAFSINIMKVIRLPNLMICTLLLSLLVLYDIFFVFITPFITPGGTSIMVDVSKGGNSNEELPMVLKVPYFVYPEVYDVCGIKNFSMLGFGDILVPGLLVSYVHSFDLRVGTPFRLYYVVNIIAYGIGLLLTFLVLYLMRGAQPALVYLVPCTLIPTVIIAAARGELSQMWTNKSFNEKNLSDVIEDYPPIVQPEQYSSESSNQSGSYDNINEEADKSPIKPNV